MRCTAVAPRGPTVSIMKRRFDEVNGLPYLQGAQASLFCELIEHHAVGTHSVMLASVERVLTSAYADPLVYLDGRFRAIDPTR